MFLAKFSQAKVEGFDYTLLPAENNDGDKTIGYSDRASRRPIRKETGGPTVRVGVSPTS